MRSASLLLSVLLVLQGFGAAFAHAAEDSAQTAPRRFEKELQGVFDGQPVDYKAIVAENFIRNDAGEPAASLITTSYIRTDSAAGESRPVVFAFNGGPGAAALWLHVGLVGPRVVEFEKDIETATTPPFPLVDNPHSILDVADIVLIDPPGTGFSRVLPGADPTQFFGVRQDAVTLVRFIEDWIRENGRWHSPRFLLGASYGTVRAAVASQLLAGGPLNTGNMEGLTLNGVMLLGLAVYRPPGDISLANLVPTLAATAWYHGKVDRDAATLEQHVAAASEFAANHYLRALFAGARLGERERNDIAQRLAALTGLSADFVLENDLRVSSQAFAGELLRNRGLVVGRYDGRFTLPAAAGGGDPVADDPAMAQYVPGFIAAFNGYIRDELGVDIADEYEVIAFRDVNFRWDYGSGPGVMPTRNFAEDLATAMRRNPSLRVFAGSGYYDLVTTMGAAEYAVSHSGMDLNRVVMHNYTSGHSYLDPATRGALAKELRAFIRGSLR